MHPLRRRQSLQAPDVGLGGVVSSSFSVPSLRERLHRGVNGSLLAARWRTPPERTRVERASRFQIKLFELLRRGAELAELVNGRACGEEGERLKGFGEKLIEVTSGVRGLDATRVPIERSESS